MDKQFINIDDLVRQRLSGNEAVERSGAWANMRELLDAEMPQKKRGGFIYWRRMFGVMGVGLLIGSVGLGGYELSSSWRRDAEGSGPQHALASTAVAREASVNASAGTASSSATRSQSVANNNSSPTKVSLSHNNTQNTTGNTNTNNEVIAKVAINAVTPAALAGGANLLAANTNTSTTSLSTNSSLPGAITAVAGKETPGHSGENVRGNNVAVQGTGNPATSGDIAGATAVAHNSTKNTNSNATSGSSTSNPHEAVSTSAMALNSEAPSVGNTPADSRRNVHGRVAMNSNGQSLVGGSAAKNSTRHAGPTAAAAISAASNDAHTSNASAVSATVTKNTRSQSVTGHRTAVVATKTTNGKNNIGGKTSVVGGDPLATTSASASTAGRSKSSAAKSAKRHNTLASNKIVANILSKAAAKGNAAKHSRIVKHTAAQTGATSTASADVAVRDIPLSSAAGYTATSTISVAKTSSDVSGTSGNRRKAGKGNSASAIAMVGKKAKAKSAGGQPPIAKKSAVTSVDGSDEQAAVETANPVEGKKIEKLMLVYREQYYKTADNEGYFKLDTISLRTIGESQPIDKYGNPIAVAAKSSSRKGGSGNGNRNAATIEEMPGELAAAATIEEAPATSVTEEAAPAATTTKKELNAGKKAAGSAKLEKLTEKFNDLKYHVKGVQFAPGITAGINGTFFSPASFKGFQFGVTGEFVFSDNLSTMAELKYFHRMNNSYSLADNYNSYTEVGGQWRKQEMMNSYSFSTLHSLEMPVSVRYSSGKFSFFAGGNFLYTFGINTGAVTMPGANSTLVATQGTDNAPKLSEADFASRFGIGYLCGASFQVSPNFSIDIRNVQTVWDNAGSAGSKTISSQLYKNPSFQFSLNYRFGNTKRGED
ncbi:MAG: hypothetical protein V4649_13720 [Bacteroidota bacterium]